MGGSPFLCYWLRRWRSTIASLVVISITVFLVTAQTFSRVRWRVLIRLSVRLSELLLSVSPLVLSLGAPGVGMRSIVKREVQILETIRV